VRRAKLYYLRDRVGKRARVRERRYAGPEEAVQPGLLYEPTEATDADGLTAEETVMDGNEENAVEAAGTEGDGLQADAAGDGERQDQDGSAGESEPAPAGEAQTPPDRPTADAAQEDPAAAKTDSSADAGVAQDA
jgi:large subunit ribosomal protein L19